MLPGHEKWNFVKVDEKEDDALVHKVAFLQKPVLDLPKIRIGSIATMWEYFEAKFVPRKSLKLQLKSFMGCLWSF